MVQLTESTDRRNAGLIEAHMLLCCAGPAGGQGFVDVETSSTGIMKVLENGRPLNGRFYAFSGDEIPW